MCVRVYAQLSRDDIAWMMGIIDTVVYLRELPAGMDDCATRYLVRFCLRYFLTPSSSLTEGFHGTDRTSRAVVHTQARPTDASTQLRGDCLGFPLSQPGTRVGPSCLSVAHHTVLTVWAAGDVGYW